MICAKNLGLAIGLLSALSSAPALAKKPNYPILNLKEVTNQVTSNSLAPIQASSQIPNPILDYFHKDQGITPDTLRFVHNLTRNRLEPTPRIRPEDAQDLFTMDIAQYVQQVGAKDFQEAKVRYYGNLNFDMKSLFHERPFPYLSDWGSLFFPPEKKLVHPAEVYSKDFAAVDYQKVSSTYFDVSFQDYLDSWTQSGMTTGNKLKVLANGDSFKEKLRLIQDAKKFFIGSVMVFGCDESSQKMIEALAEKKKQGVDVRLILEGAHMGIAFRKCLKMLDRAGVDVALSSETFKFIGLDSTMHAKYWIRDAEEAVIGGQNIIDAQNSSSGFNHLNRDTELLVHGPAVTDLLGEWVKTWERQHGRKNQSVDPYLILHRKMVYDELHAGLRGSENYTKWLNDPALRMNGNCRVLVQGKQTERYRLSRMMIALLLASKSHVIMSSPTIQFDLARDPSEQNWIDFFWKTAIQRSNDGVNVQLLTNGIDGGYGEATMMIRRKVVAAEAKKKKLTTNMWKKIGLWIDRGAARTNREMIQDLSRRAPKMGIWNPFQYIHAKQLYFDRIMVGVSSYNLDKNSSETNQESGIYCMDENLSHQFDALLLRDMVNSIPAISKNGL
ncbi:MAG: phosphatidylserine/phosphatidylglycerophosphate/cardiolipin synthase family protein [Bdellovibrionales bacterium]|nr:phosphatidylserine/phosphatidylglycerophosphate/cardiolipin synthase family protein [Bdellovibrionales bacterium]